jgi:uncharacterized protein
MSTDSRGSLEPMVGDSAMCARFREFQIFAKPVGARCNLTCHYCYYQQHADQAAPVRMSDDLLETYIAQHIEACTDPVIQFSWHGGEPTLMGLDAFHRIVTLQEKHRPAERVIANGRLIPGGPWRARL